jgi:hypothetical protein
MFLYIIYNWLRNTSWTIIFHCHLLYHMYSMTVL